MSEYSPGSPEFETEPALDRVALVERLQSLGIDVELEDWEDEDDNDILGTLATLAMQYDIDMDELFRGIGLAIESRRDYDAQGNLIDEVVFKGDEGEV